VPDVLSESVVAAVREWALEHGASIAFVSGSIVSGFAHELSDLDVYVVTEHPVPAIEAAGYETYNVSPPLVPIVTEWRPTGRWDVELWLHTQIAQLLAKLSPEPADASREVVLSDEDIDFFYRLEIAVPVLGAEWLEQRQRQLRDGPIHQLVAARCFNTADGYIEDVEGMLSAGDLASAVLAARLAFGQAVDGVCAAHGSLQISPKWRARRVRTLPAEVLTYDAYWSIESMSELHRLGEESWCRDTLAVAGQLIERTDISP
jgi:hypothetical protein